MSTKEKITLTREQETLLIPLYSKAQDNPLFNDEKARQILAGVDYDFDRLKTPQKTAVTLRIRAKQLDAYTRRFINAHNKALILHLGCGLDSRCERVERARNSMVRSGHAGCHCAPPQVLCGDRDLSPDRLLGHRSILDG